MGHHVTQATLSRDIHELNLSKGPNGYSLPNNGSAEEDDDQPAIQGILQNFGLEVRQALNLIVVITRTSGAQPVAATIDYEEWPEVTGHHRRRRHRPRHLPEPPQRPRRQAKDRGLHCLIQPFSHRYLVILSEARSAQPKDLPNRSHPFRR